MTRWRPAAKWLPTVRNGWPTILSSLKSLLETGEPLALTRVAPMAADTAA